MTTSLSAILDNLPASRRARIEARYRELRADAQHLANLAQADPWTVRHAVGARIYRLRTLAEADRALARGINGL